MAASRSRRSETQLPERPRGGRLLCRSSHETDTRARIRERDPEHGRPSIDRPCGAAAGGGVGGCGRRHGREPSGGRHVQARRPRRCRASHAGGRGLFRRVCPASSSSQAGGARDVAVLEYAPTPRTREWLRSPAQAAAPSPSKTSGGRGASLTERASPLRFLHPVSRPASPLASPLQSR